MQFYSPNPLNRSPYPYRNEFIYQSKIVWIGTFNCHHSHSDFSGKNLFQWEHMVVFPRTSVALKMSGYDPVIGSPNIAILYNHGAVYERNQLTEEGDCCEYFQFSPKLLLEVISAHDPTVQERPKHPFIFNHTFVEKHVFLRQRSLVNAINHSQLTSSLQIDEMAIEVLESLIEHSFSQKGKTIRTKKATRIAHNNLANEALKLLVTRYHERLTLQEIAESLFVSPYHLSRVFRQQTGRPLYQFLEQLRLRNAFERLGDYRNDLNRLALETGYNSHSHFTAAFKRQFGQPPSNWAQSNLTA